MRPIGSRVFLKVNIKTDKDGNEIIEQEAKVIESNVDDVKKGDTVFFNQYGAVSVNSMKTKKNIFLIVDAEDIYAVQ
jgi:co-chaperonin GroES (HSP10)